MYKLIAGKQRSQRGIRTGRARRLSCGKEERASDRQRMKSTKKGGLGD